MNTERTSFFRAFSGGPMVCGLLLTTIAIIAVPHTLNAHHEAIFGPQSSLVLSADRFVSLQSFTKQTGTAAARTQETTSLVSAGFA